MIFNEDNRWFAEVSGSLYTLEFLDGAVYIGQAPTCIAHGDACTCVAVDVVSLHKKMPSDDELRRRLKAGDLYTLSVVVPSIPKARRRDVARQRLTDKLIAAGTRVIVIPVAVKVSSSRQKHNASLRAAWARRKAATSATPTATAIMAIIDTFPVGVALPSYREIAERANCSISSVQNTVRRLLEQGRLVVTGKKYLVVKQ